MDAKETALKKECLKVTVIGGGLVGALGACFLAKRGHHVDLYEYRDDIRQMEHVKGRSINLALSVRGVTALKELGLYEKVITEHGIPMYARMIHDINGEKTAIPYGRKDQCIYSVSRRYLNETLLTAAEKYSNLTLHFEHKLIKTNTETRTLTFLLPQGQQTCIGNSDLIVGADGAFSTVRREMLKKPQFQYSQTYIEHGYLELSIPPTPKSTHAMEKNYLHIWPRGNFMLIALPNQDGSFTVTLFMPLQKFDELKTEEQLSSFFKVYFRDAVDLIGERSLLDTFFNNTPGHLVSIKCSPYHYNGFVIMGDAAHAMVPFYGQGMNAGFEDVFIFDQLLTKYKDVEQVLPAFSRKRNPDAEAICDLAMYNYVEMRHLVNTVGFRLRKKVDNLLYKLFPNLWVPLYTSVTFSQLPYHQCAKNKQWQDKILVQVSSTLMVVSTGVVAFWLSSSRIF